MPYSAGFCPTGECTVQAKRWKKAGLNTARFKQLAYVFQRVHGVLLGLRGKPVHQIGMHQHACLGKAVSDTRHLVDRDAFFFISCSRRSEATSSPPEMAIQPLSASNWHKSGVNDFSNRTLPHHEIATLRRSSSCANAFSTLGGAASSTKWKPVWPVSAMMARCDQPARWRKRPHSAKCNPGSHRRTSTFFQ